MPRTVAAPGPARSNPVTVALISANVLLFMLTAFQSASFMDNSRSSTIFSLLVLEHNAVADGQWWRVLGSAFLHFGLIHLGLNMLALFIVGRDIETLLGGLRLGGLYFASLLGGALAVLVFQGGGATAGASGAVFGLFGAEAVILLQLRRSPAPILWILGINFVFSVLMPGVSLWGHVGGAAAGAIACGLMFTVPAAIMRGSARTDRERARLLGLGVLGGICVVEVVLIAAWISWSHVAVPTFVTS